MVTLVCMYVSLNEIINGGLPNFAANFKFSHYSWGLAATRPACPNDDEKLFFFLGPMI